MSTRALRRRRKTTVSEVIAAVAARAGVTVEVAARVLKAYPLELAPAVWRQRRVRWPRLATFKVHFHKKVGGLVVIARIAKSWRRRDV